MEAVGGTIIGASIFVVRRAMAVASLKVEFSTVRELEKKSAQVFSYGGGAFFVGLVLIFIAPPIGVFLVAISAPTVLAAMIGVSILGKERTRQVFCPYCSSKNEVYVSRTKLNCDICRRPILIDQNGEAVMAQPIDLTPQHNRKVGE